MGRNPLIKEIPYPAKPVPGYGGKYFIDIHGNVYRRYEKSGSFRQLTPYLHHDDLVVKLTDNAGKSKAPQVHRMVAAAFLPHIPPGMVVCHKNVDRRDPALHNLEVISKQDLGRRTGHKSRRRAVAKFDWRTQDIVEVYRSARQAAKENFMSYQTIIDRCNGKVKGPIAPDGFIYQWDL